MAAVLVPTPTAIVPWHRPEPADAGLGAHVGGRPHLRVLDGGSAAARAQRRAARPAARQRRSSSVGLRPSTLLAGLATALVVAFALIGLVHLVGAGTAASAPVPTAVAPPAAAVTPVVAPTVVVRPGETLWSIARDLQPSGDVRNLVDRLAERAGGAELVPGQRIDTSGL